MPRRHLLPSIVIVVILTAGITAYFMYRPNAARLLAFRTWINDPASHPDWRLATGSQFSPSCPRMTEISLNRKFAERAWIVSHQE